jgi:DNA polymerase-3 subunit delta'
LVVSALNLLPWQGPALSEALKHLRTSAAVIHGEPGCGQLELAMALAKAWLCEAPRAESAQMGSGATAPACGACPSCHLIDQGYHPDLKVIVPEAMQASLGWDHGEDDSSDDKVDGKKRKPSTEIKVEAIRQVVSFSQSTVSRGRAKVVVIHPADRMNTVSANTLLKTLEEPPGHVRFVLSCGALDELLPTVRSRCQAWRLPMPEASQVRDWLQGQGGTRLSESDAELVLAAAGGSPQGAVDLLKMGWSASVWRGVLADIQRGVAGPWAAWPLPKVVDLLQKLCHDLASMAAGAGPRFFPADALSAQGHLERLTAWAIELRKAQRHADHPWNGPLKVEALLYQARRAVRVG